MNMNSVVAQWEQLPRSFTAKRQVDIPLTNHQHASIKAIQEMYPSLSEDQIIHQLLDSAILAFEEALPYKQGKRVIAEDEMGDPIFEDIGPTPRFIELVEKHSH